MNFSIFVTIKDKALRGEPNLQNDLQLIDLIYRGSTVIKNHNVASTLLLILNTQYLTGSLIHLEMADVTKVIATNGTSAPPKSTMNLICEAIEAGGKF